MSAAVPRTFRRESRLFLWVALFLILFLNLLTLFFFRRAVDWGSESIERRASEILRRLPVDQLGEGAGGGLGRVALERDIVYVATYDLRGRRVRMLGGEIDAPDALTTAVPAPGKIAVAWRLLQFLPTDRKAPIRLGATRAEVQAAPEYKEKTEPAQVVAPPAEAPATPTAPQ